MTDNDPMRNLREKARFQIQHSLAVALLALTAAGGLAASAGDATAQDKHGSLAIDSNRGSRWGWAVDYADQGAADRDALKECQERGGRCSVVMRFRNACAAYAADVQDRHGSLAIDSNQGSRWGWAVDYADQGAADRDALKECQERGGQCGVVMRFHNACAAYAADQARSSTAYGWAWSEQDRATAERMAQEECVKRGGAGSNCVVRVWGCTARSGSPDSSAYGWAWSEQDRATAEQMALEECAKRGGASSNCVVRVWGCTTRSARADDSEEGRESVSFKVGQRFRDCPECPGMVVVPAGTFRMGAPKSEKWSQDNERPVHSVSVPSFAAGVYELTFAEWDACAASGGCGGHRPKDAGWGRGRRPAIHVSWDDAQSYVRWLSKKTGKRYRLLSESEWEYAARAGTRTPFHTGSTISTGRANYAGYAVYGSGREGVYREKTVPVGSFPANAWGLHDVHGNVWEWVEDCWNENYQGAPRDGSAWVSGDCSDRVLRGGSWLNEPGVLRSANRNWSGTGNRVINSGFRVARTLTP